MNVTPMMMHSVMFPPDFGWIFLPLLIYGMSALMHRLRRRQVGSDQFPQNTRNESVPEAAIYRVAQKHGGRLTVSELIIDTGLPSEEAEKLLQAMSDGTHVRMDVSSNGVVWYEFPEIVSRAIGETKSDSPLEEKDGD